MSRFNKNIFHTEGALSHNYVPKKERERTVPVAKTRWHPKPDQIQILEAIVNSGMVNPPSEEIKRIRGQLEEFGHVEDANVFYWFQNRKARVKRKRISRRQMCKAPIFIFIFIDINNINVNISSVSTCHHCESSPLFFCWAGNFFICRAPLQSAGEPKDEYYSVQ